MIILPNLKGAIIRPNKIQKILILAGGGFTSYNGTARNRITRLNTDGTIDSSFTIGTGFAGGVNTIAVQSDGKIVCGGTFSSYNGTARNYIARLNADGTIDSSFTIGTGFAGISVNTIAVQSDGKIVCGGFFTSYNGTARNYIARLNTGGTIDSSFTIGTGFSNNVSAITVQSDGKIVCGGGFTSYNGTARNRITRLNTDGTIDSSFTIGTGFAGGTVNVITIQSDGKIVCGGTFSSYNGTTSNRIARLNTDGTIDSSFTTGAGFSNTVSAIAIQSDGKIVCGGLFTSYNGTTSNRIARLNTDGTIDSSFTIGTGFAGGVNTIAVQSDGKIVCGGSFTSYNGTTNNRIALLNSDGTIDGNFAGGTRFNNSVSAIK